MAPLCRALCIAAVTLTLLPPAVGWTTTADDVCPATADPCVVGGAVAVVPGSILDFGSRALDITSSGKLTVSGGLMTILAGSVQVESHGALLGVLANSTAASIKVTTSGGIQIQTGAAGDALVNVSTVNAPGEIDLIAHGDVTIAGQVAASGTNSAGCGGMITVTSDGNVTLGGTAPLAARGGPGGLGGTIIVQAGGTASVTGPIRADGGCGGDIEIYGMTGNVTTSANLDVSSNATSGDGGCVTLMAQGNVTIGGSVLEGSQGDLANGGGTGGNLCAVATTGTLVVAGPIDTHGAAPDGCGGCVDLAAGTDLLQTASIADQGNGGGACGGETLADVGRILSIGATTDVSGGFCGGDVNATAIAMSVGSAGQLNADGGQLAGTLTVTAQQITTQGPVHATGTGTNAAAGQVQLTGCTLSVPSGGSVKSDGLMGENLLQASGQLTIGGTISSRPTGKNRFEYLDPTKPPTILGTAIIRPTQDCASATATGCLNPALAACTLAPVCGDGIVEPGEQCDDGNTIPCDGCSATCQLEYCGDGRVECGKQCDDGPLNGTPGDPCDATCHTVPAVNTILIPAAHHGAHGCTFEWKIQTHPVGGFPPTAQTCIDGDPACDADGLNDGSCAFRVNACLNVTDARLPLCHDTTVDIVKVRRPSPISPADAVEAANAQALVAAVEALGVTVKSGDTILQTGTPDASANHCTQPVLIRVPHAPGAVGRRLLSGGAIDVLGDRPAVRVSLSCLPNPAVCGNGIVELGEECDDGNTADCDGCDHNCKIERCGNGFVQCHEQCDDGPLNGTPGDPCSANCWAVPPPNRIPDGSGPHECISEFALATDHLAMARDGLPSPKQVCVDGDPGCDFDSTPGNCRFHLWQCFGGADSRIACAADAVAQVGLLRPSATQTGPAALARQALQVAFGLLSFPTASAETCTERIDLDVPAGRSRLVVKTLATATDGVRDGDTLRLTCAPAGTVLR